MVIARTQIDANLNEKLVWGWGLRVLNIDANNTD